MGKSFDRNMLVESGQNSMAKKHIVELFVHRITRRL
jgi:hypothetical protein